MGIRIATTLECKVRIELAARVAAKKGYGVTLVEKNKALGGQLNIAQVPLGRMEIRRVLQSLQQAVSTESVARHLGEAAAPQSV